MLVPDTGRTPDRELHLIRDGKYGIKNDLVFHRELNLMCISKMINNQLANVRFN